MQRLFYTLALMLAAALGRAQPMEAQRLSVAWPGQAADSNDRVLDMFGGGVLGAGVGAIGGGLLGAAFATAGCARSGDEDCGLAHILVGAAIGEVALLPLGVHLGNRSRGSYAANLAVSVAVLLIGSRVDLPQGAGVLIPAAQLIAGAATESATARRRGQP